MFFFVRTANPRPTFHLDMTAQERAVMADHVTYWTSLADDGVAVVFGPVADPAGAYGVGVYEAPDAETMQRLLDADPARDLLHSTCTPMFTAVVGAGRRRKPEAPSR